VHDSKYSSRMIANLLYENQLTPEEGARLMDTLTRDEAPMKTWIGDKVYVDSDRQVNLLIGSFNALDRAVEALTGSFVVHYVPEEQSPTIHQVRAALCDELSKLCQRIIEVFASGDDTKRLPDLDLLYDHVLARADLKGACPVNGMEEVLRNEKSIPARTA